MHDLLLLPDSLSYASFWGLVILSGFTSMLTASFGIGGGMLLLAVIAQTIPMKAIIPVHGAVQLGSNAGRMIVMFKDIVWSHFAWFALGSLLGALVGGQLVVNLPTNLLKACLGGFILLTVWGPQIWHSNLFSNLANTKSLLIGGVASTFLTMFIGATGPLVLTTIRIFKLTRLALVATSAACLVLQHALKVLVFGLLGFAFSPYFLLILLMICSGFIGTLIGKKLLIKADEQRFQAWLKIILSVLALRLIYLASR
ncbi:MAG: sulfite exporter TauE/SafE family protein [Arenicella sp.]|nr:sulfite exporter TauE/SafE family protein [Arenicella sp.]